MMKIFANNKRALFDYVVHETFEAGLALTGAEVKSIRLGRVNLKGSYVVVRSGTPWLTNCHISAYQAGNQPDYDPTHGRRLLLNRKEIDYLIGASERAGYTIIPLEIFAKGGLLKLKIGLCKSRKKFDKRELIKKRSQDREIERALRRAKNR